MGRVADKVAVVTGGGSGIGAAAARALAAEGAAVVIADINDDAGRALAEEITGGGSRAVAVRCDVSDPADVRGMADAARDAFGGVDVLVNNAAAVHLTQRDGCVADLELEVWQQMLAVNLTGSMLCAKYTIPQMLERGGGSVITVSSAAALAGEDGLTSYGSSKAGLIGLSRAIAVQYGKQGVRSNVICPGFTRTPATLEMAPPWLLDVLVNSHLTERVGEPEDQAAAIVFLASNESAFITGAVLPVDGGLTSFLPYVPALRAGPPDA